MSNSSSATLAILNQSQTKEILITVLPFEEQQKIVDYINSESIKFDQTISMIQREIDLLQECRTALISEAVTGKVDVRDEVSV